MPKLKKKKFKTGKIKRHQFKKKLGIKSGFGKAWSAPALVFRVEFSWEDENQDTSNERVDWVECRRFSGEEREFLKTHYASSSETWAERETLESKFVCVWCSNYLVRHHDELKINQAFIFPAPKKDNENIRMPIYQIRWTEELAKKSVFDDNIMLVFKNSIHHHQNAT